MSRYISVSKEYSSYNQWLNLWKEEASTRRRERRENKREERTRDKERTSDKERTRDKENNREGARTERTEDVNKKKKERERERMRNKDRKQKAREREQTEKVQGSEVAKGVNCSVFDPAS